MSAIFRFDIADAVALLPKGTGTLANLAQWLGTSRRELKLPFLTLKKRGFITAKNGVLTPTNTTIDVVAPKVLLSFEAEIGTTRVHVVPPVLPVLVDRHYRGDG